MKKIRYFKITNENENHFGFQYEDGLNILKEKFINDPLKNIDNGLFFTTDEYIHEYYDYGIYLREVFLPIDDNEFKICCVPKTSEFRANRIILGKKFLLSDPETYIKNQIRLPTFEYCYQRNYMELIKLLLTEENIHKNNDIALQWNACHGNFDIVKLLIENGANIHANSDYPLVMSARNGHIKIVHFLLCKTNFSEMTIDRAIKYSNVGDHYDIINLFLKKVNPNTYLKWGIDIGKLPIIKLILNNGADVSLDNFYIFKQSIDRKLIDIIRFLLSNNKIKFPNELYYKAMKILEEN